MKRALLFLLVLAGDLLTVCPTIYWRDAAEFENVLWSLGVPHPAGSPTYLLLGKPLMLLPLGTIALRANLVSAVFHALAAVLLFELAALLAQDFAARRLAQVAAFLLALRMAFSPSFWMTAGFAEVYTMNAAFMVAMLWCGVKAFRSGDRRFFYLGAFLYGLSAGVHATVVFFMPAFAWIFVATGLPKGKRKVIWWREFCICSFFFWLGFSTFVYLPIRSVANPTFDWGNPQTWEQFLVHVTDRKTRGDHFAVDWTSTVTAHFPRYLHHLHHELGILVVGLAAFGAFLQARRHGRLFGFLLLAFLGNVVFFFNWKTGDGFIPSNIILAIWSAVGLSAALQGLNALRAKKKAPAVQWERPLGFAFALYVLFQMLVPSTGLGGISAYEFADKSHFQNADDTARRELQRLPQDAIAITTLFWFPMRYLQDVERERPDVDVIMASDVLAPEYFNPLSRQRFPRLNLPELEPLKTPWTRYMPEFINRNIERRRIYFEPQLTMNKPVYKNLRPDSFLFEIVEDRRDGGLAKNERAAFLRQIGSIISAEDTQGAFSDDINSREYYMSFLLFSADVFILHGHFEEARSLLQVADDIRPGQGAVRFYLAQCDLHLDRQDRGLRALRALQHHEPKFDKAYETLVAYHLATGDLAESRRYAQLSEHFGVVSPGSVTLRDVEAAWRDGQISKARQLLAAVDQHLDPGDPQAHVAVHDWRAILQELDGI